MLYMKNIIKRSQVVPDKEKEIEKIEKAIKEAYTRAEKFLKSEEKRNSNSFQVKFN